MNDAKVEKNVMETKGDISKGLSFNFALHLARESTGHCESTIWLAILEPR